MANAASTVTGARVTANEGSPPTPPTTPTEPTRPSEPVEGEGVITSVSTSAACPTFQFFISTYLIKVSATTQYVGGAALISRPGRKSA